MSYIGTVLLGIFFMQILHWHHHLIIFVNGDVAISCGSVDNSTALDGRKWVGESASEFISGKSRSSIAPQASFQGADPVPYQTSRISATEFRYTFRLNPGQKFIRLHFYPALYHGFEKSVDYFSVQAGPFTLLRNYSASLAADNLGVKCIVKEFCLMGGGAVVRDNTGMVLLAESYFWGHGSSLQAEAYALLQGLALLQQHGWQNVHIESDSSVLVQLIHGAPGVPWALRSAFSAIRRLLLLTNASVRHIFREGNSVADFLARHATATQTNTSFTAQSFPRKLAGRIRLDEIGFPIIRVCTKLVSSR